MAVLEEKQRTQLQDIFKGLEYEVKMLMFSRESDCPMCKLTRELLEEVKGLSDKITLAVHDFNAAPELAKKYGVDKIPALILLGERDYGIRFYGIPAGYEFTTLIEDVLSVGRRNPGLSAEVLAELAAVDKPVHIQVMISTTCPYCPSAVRAAHRFAMANEFITADMVETAEFPDLIAKYDVHGVPHTIINETYHFIGPLPENEFAHEVLRAIGKEAPPAHIHLEPGANPVTALPHEHAYAREHGPELEHEHQHFHQPVSEPPAQPQPEKTKAQKGAKKKPKK